ncbi:DNA-directed RNA polymerase I, II, and III subunit RPABC4 [Sphaceloma murrayae]|uniref:DNA-directed RNA polymerase I, II, and III subunit RPABC4 n=1 Tax=Sphaceloma murrayae TaxID=2082308 RepID=A0A2K1QYC7_9PEZI|nr:DNA-directed RNA polymerase I, II, and III subunit RPABC4 [Sphaceloma murrayae]
MSREAFQAPSLPAQGASNTTFAPSTSFNADDTTKPVAYLCGDCDHKVFLKRGDPIRCKECGYRVLYKQRTERLIQL